MSKTSRKRKARQRLTAQQSLQAHHLPVEIELFADGNVPRFDMSPAYNGQSRLSVRGFDAPVVVELATASFERDQVKINADHDRKRIVGHSESQSINEQGIFASGLLSKINADVTRLVTESKNHYPHEASIEAQFPPAEFVPAGQTVRVNGHDQVGPFYLARHAVITGIAILDTGADRTTTVSIAASAATNQEEDSEMTTVTDSLTAEQVDEILSSADAQYLRAEEMEKIRTDVSAGTLTAGDLRCRVRLAAMHHGLAQRNGGGGNISIPTGSNANPTDVLTAALLKKSGLHAIAEKSFDAQTLEAADPLSRRHNLDLTEFALRAEGKHVPSDRSQLLASGVSTLSLPTALNNAMGKTLEQTFRDTPATYKAFARMKQASDFKEQTGLRAALLGKMEQVAGDGEIKHGSITEAIYNWKIDTFAKTLFVTRQDWINDNTGFLGEIAPGLARMASRGVADLVYTILLSNAGNFFSVGNKNLGTDALSVDALSAGITAMRKQVDENLDTVDISPIVLVVPPEIEDLAKTILRSSELQRDTSVDKSPTGNPHEDRLSLQVEPRLSNSKFTGFSASDWYLFASPAENAMTVGTLDGRDFPQVDFFDLLHDPSKLAIGWRCYLDYGAAFGEFRAAYKGGA